MNIVHKTALVAGALCVMFAVQERAGAQEAQPRVNIISIADDAYPRARAIVGIENATGDAAPLTAENFAVNIGVDAAAVVSAELAGSEDAPLDLLFVIDTSGSMEGAPIAGAKSAAKALVAELGAQDRVGIINFGDQVQLALDYTADRGAVNAAIDGLVAQGNTALYQATAAAAVKISTSPASRRVVVLLSDGADFGGRSAATREESIAAAASSGVTFFTIAQGSDLDLPYLQQVADVTRGRMLQAPRPEDLNALYVSIGRLLRSQYVVTFDASAVTPGQPSNVVVTVTSGGAVSSAEALYTPGVGFAPTITISGVAPGETIDIARDLTATVSSGTPRVRWYVDGVNVLEQTAPPYVFRFDPAQFAEGDHVVRAAIGDGAAAVEGSVAVKSVPPPAAGGGFPLVQILLVLGALVLVVAGYFLFLRPRKPRAEAPIPADQRTKSWAQQVADKRAATGDAATASDADVAKEDIGKVMGRLISRSGNDVGREYDVGGKPVSVGAGPRCGVRIDDPELATEEARIWVRGEHLMLHLFTRLSSVEAGGRGGGWQILEPGDTFRIGEHTFEFQSLAAAGAEHAVEDVPDILRDREPPPSGRLSDLMPRAD